MKVRWTEPVRRAFFELLRCGVWRRVPDTACFESLGEGGWRELYRLVSEQSVAGVCYPPIEQLPTTVRPPRDLLLTWFFNAEQIQEKNRRMREAIFELTDELETAGFSPVLMKGLAAAQVYPEPLLRVTGDIDFYISERYQEAMTWLRAKGYETDYTPQHEKIHYKGFLVEFHHALLNPPMLAEAEDRFIEIHSGAGRPFRVPDVEANALLLLMHAAGHLLVNGIGFRHVCDWLLFYQQHRERLGSETFRHRLRRIGIEPFAQAITSVGVDCLGLDSSLTWGKRGRDPFLTDDLLRNGDCGFRMFRRRQSRIAKKGIGQVVRDRCIYYANACYRVVRLSPYWPRLAVCLVGVRMVAWWKSRE